MTLYDIRKFWIVHKVAQFCPIEKLQSYTPSRIMTRLSLALFDLLTPFDLRAQTFRVNVELPTHNHEHSRKKFLLAERSLSDIFQRRIFFEYVHDNKKSYTGRLVIVMIGEYGCNFSIGQYFTIFYTTLDESNESVS